MDHIRPRVVALSVAMVCALWLGVAAWLTPSEAGHGTHTQLGMPPCAWAVALDAPCATCGMTTAFAYAAEGRILTSAHTQPFGMLLAVAASVVFWAGLYQGLTGARLDSIAGRLFRGRVLIGMGVLFLAAWGYKLMTWNGTSL